MKHLLLMLALTAPLALAACDNSSDTQTSDAGIPAAMEPAAGDEDATTTVTTSETTTTMDAATGDTTTTTTETSTTMPSEPVVAPDATTAEDTTTPSTECGDHSAWVGKKISEIQAEVDAMGDKVRVLGPDSAATMDYRADRVNVIIDGDSIVTEVRCG